ncbi:4577_t:CDS:2 [Scutellospora calospora]|uniref:4577_t:CDS:1 n=1 Tax=Scutellospora calospora TaxID=85575 RepID=A0ACA9JXK9_9GLOM|nr:4577_t:CDS:2 [Scutellospora calospora]
MNEASDYMELMKSLGRGTKPKKIFTGNPNDSLKKRIKVRKWPDLFPLFLRALVHIDPQKWPDNAKQEGEALEFLQSLPDKSVALAFFDPQYEKVGDEELSPPIEINEPLPSFFLNIEEPPEEEPNDIESTPECGESGDDEPEIEEREREPDPEADRDINQEIKEQEKEPTDRDCEVKESDNEK